MMSDRDMTNRDANNQAARAPYGSLALSMRERTHAAPPSRASLSRCPAVMRRLTVTVSSPSASGFRPCPRSSGGLGGAVFMAR